MSATSTTVNAASPRLPPELFRPIIQQLGRHRPTLLALLLSHNLFREDGERELYHTLDASSASIPSLHFQFLSTIIRNPHLAALVREYHSLDIVRHREGTLWDLTHQALPLMTGLKVLHFRTFSGDASAELLLNTTFKLEVLHWSNRDEGQDMATFLAQQDQLRCLYLQARRGTSFPMACCPHLEVLAGNWVTLDALLPNRCIESVAWVPAMLESPLGTASRDMGLLGEALRHIKSLSLGFLFQRPHLGVIVDYLTRLERLELVDVFAGEPALLQRLESLRELVLSFNRVGSRLPFIPPDINKRHGLARDIFSQCPNLHSIDIAQDLITSTRIRYVRWTRDLAQDPSTIYFGSYVKCRGAGAHPAV